MGKPSSTSISKKSIANSKSKSNMSLSLKMPKMINKKKKNKRRTRKNIDKLITQLQSESDLLSSFSETSISFDNTIDMNADTITYESSKAKRKMNIEDNSSRKKMRSDSVIIINDNDIEVDNENPCTHTPKKKCSIQCSTPILKKDSKAMSELLVNTFPNNNNSNTIPNLNENIINLTKEINADSYLTIDLTGNDSIKDNKNSELTAITILDESNGCENTVIDLVNKTDAQDCSIISVVRPELSEHSLSGESDVTVLRKQTSAKTHMRKIAKGFAKLNASDRDHILEYITEKIFNGCNMQSNVKKNPSKETVSNKERKEENEYIKQVILGKSPSRNSVGSNIYHPDKTIRNKTGLRMIVIDGSNVAMEHGKGKLFSVEGLKICIEYFMRRGHRVKAFVPRFRCKFGKSTNPRLLDSMEREGNVVYTPSREVKGRMITPYDDRYIIQCAAEFDGVIVTGDNYRDLLHENAKWRFVIENRLLPFTWVDNMIMFPRDPLGRNGPTLEEFLRHPNQ